MLELCNIKKSFNIGTPDETCLFDSFGFSVEEGEFVSVIGSNGSGKTTLLNLICGTDTCDGGHILFDGRDITHLPEYKRSRFIGRVFQDPKAGTCSNMSILENMALADCKSTNFGLVKCVNRRREDYYRTLVEECGMGLENRMSVPVGALSGGQRQALALVIASMMDIRFLILDEHTAALDPKSSETIMHLTDKMVTGRKITTLMVTHNLRFAVEYGTRLVMMHEGGIVLDTKGEKKAKTTVDDLTKIFNDISIEMGN